MKPNLGVVVAIVALVAAVVPVSADNKRVVFRKPDVTSIPPLSAQAKQRWSKRLDVRLVPAPEPLLTVSVAKPATKAAELNFFDAATVSPAANVAIIRLPTGGITVDWAYDGGAVYLVDCTITAKGATQVDVSVGPNINPVSLSGGHMVVAAPGKATQPGKWRRMSIYNRPGSEISFHGCEITKVK